MSHVAHRAAAPASVRCFILTVSDTRTEETDTGGRAIETLLTEHGHTVVGKQIIRDEPADVTRIVRERIASPETQAVITTGGTGITSRDRTYEAVTTLLEKRLDGFGELFRMLSYQEIGSAAIMSRACAGLAQGTIIILLPGSEPAVRLAMTKLVLPELGHLVREAGR